METCPQRLGGTRHHRRPFGPAERHFIRAIFSISKGKDSTREGRRQTSIADSGEYDVPRTAARLAEGHARRICQGFVVHRIRVRAPIPAVPASTLNRSGGGRDHPTGNAEKSEGSRGACRRPGRQ
jgi:hypothetical protein